MNTGLVLAVVGLLGVGAAFAQETTDAPDAPQRIEVEAADGLVLVGDLYNAQLNVQTPAVLLLHETNGKRDNWSPLVPSLVEAGYRVLAVDLRGHGESYGAMDWELAQDDVKVWLDWMHSQPSIRPDRIGVIGSSVGGNLALIGCALDGACATAIAISPGLDYFGLMPEQYVVDSMGTRPVLLITSRGDGRSSDAVRQMTASATGEVGSRIYMGSLHGTNLFEQEQDDLTALILYWLESHVPRDFST